LINSSSRSGLSLDRLRSFLAFAQAGSIAKAAPGDVNHQSQISRQISELETFFATELTERRGKTLALSTAGQRLATLIQEQLQDLDDFRREQAQMKKVFTIGAGASTLEWLVTPHLPLIAEQLGGALLRTELRRSRPLVEGVQDGRVDLAVLRKDAIPDATRHNCHPIMKLTFHLCILRGLVKRGVTQEQLSDPKLWDGLPFAAGRANGQMDTAVREGMAKVGVDFKPRFECGSMLQVRQIVKQGHCAAVLPNLALPGIDERTLFVIPFTPLSSYGRQLVLHWNPRQMQRRGVEAAQLRSIAALFV
jgi:DNA-binding transcriptional LysR family regulator